MHFRAITVIAKLEATYMANNRAMVGQIQTHSFSAVLLHSRETLETCKLCHHRKDVSDMILSVCVCVGKQIENGFYIIVMIMEE